MSRLATIDRELSRELSLSAFDLEGEPLPTGAEDIAATVRLIWSAVYRNWRLIAAIVSTTTIAAIAITMLMTPKYDATASVQIEQQETKVLASDDTDPTPVAEDADRFLQTQKDILQSRTLASRVVDSLGLDRNDRLSQAMHSPPADQPVGTLDLAATRHKHNVDLVEKSLTVDIPKNSRIATITFRSPDPVFASQIANSYAQNFIQWNIKRKYDNSSYARNFLEQQLEVTKGKLEDSERAMIAYARKAGLIDASAGLSGTSSDGTSSNSGPQSLTTSNLVQMNNSYVAAQAARMAAQQRWEQASKTTLMDLPEVLSNPAILALTQHRAELQSAYTQELQRRQADYPTMRQAAAQIKELNKQIRTLAASVRDTIHDNYLTALKQENALSGGVNVLKADTLSEQDRGVKYNILKRETDTNRTMYDGLLQRFKEVSTAAGISASNISIIDNAEVPTAPVSPKTKLNVALGMLLGLTLSAFVVLLREKFDDVVRSPDEVIRKLGLPLLNSVPRLRDGTSPQEALIDPRSALSEAYAALRASIDLSSASGAPRTLLITSSRQAEGKTTSAYAIARDFATIGRRVLLIDGDLRKPSLHRSLGVANSIGLANLLSRTGSLEEAIQTTEYANLFFIGSGPLPPNPAELLSGPLLPALLENLKTNFDMIVIDGPPVLGLADAILLASNVEGTVFVIEANGSHRGHAKAALRRLLAANRNILGTILTKFDARKIGYGYGYGYSDYYTYGGGDQLGQDGEENPGRLT
jgi:capsular exopolysaccharide synthesis family protein